MTPKPKKGFIEVLKSYDIHRNKPMYEDILEAHHQELKEIMEEIKKIKIVNFRTSCWSVMAKTKMDAIDIINRRIRDEQKKP